METNGWVSPTKRDVLNTGRASHTRSTPQHNLPVQRSSFVGREREMLEVGQARVGMGVHPFGDPRISDEFAAETVPIDAREFHVYTAEWTPEHVTFCIDGEHLKAVGQSPSYPMQLMLSLYEFPDAVGEGSTVGLYPKEFVVDYVRGYRWVPS